MRSTWLAYLGSLNEIHIQVCRSQINATRLVSKSESSSFSYLFMRIWVWYVSLRCDSTINHSDMKRAELARIHMAQPYDNTTATSSVLKSMSLHSSTNKIHDNIVISSFSFARLFTFTVFSSAFYFFLASKYIYILFIFVVTMRAQIEVNRSFGHRTVAK